ncbi:MAG: glycosyltransferase [Gaiellaceae bacterium]
MSAPPLWLVAWSDSEDEDFRAACAEAGVEAEVARVAPLGPTVGTSGHRLRSWPAYVRLAARARRWPGPVVAWDPIAGSLAARLRRGVVVLNPLLDPEAETLRQRFVLGGARQAERVLFFSRAAEREGVALGLDAERVGFVPLGVRAPRETAVPPGSGVLGVGRERRDWDTLARAAQGLDLEVRVVGPASAPPPLSVLPAVERGRLLELMEAAAAVVVPLRDARRPAGQLAVLDALAAGRGVVATRAPGTEDYITPETGVLVPPGDAGALRDALRNVADPATAASLGEAALRAARGPFALARFVRDVDEAARARTPAERARGSGRT